MKFYLSIKVQSRLSSSYCSYFGQGVGAQGSYHQQVCPLAQLDVQHGITSFVPHQPLVPIVENGHVLRHLFQFEEMFGVLRYHNFYLQKYKD